jgi:hypothetical protein
MTGAQLPRMTSANPAGSCRIMSGVATSWRVAWSWPCTVQDACLHSRVAASRVLVSVAGQEHLYRGGVHDDLPAVVLPASGELGLAVHDGADLDALAARIRRPGRQWYRADLGDLVQAHPQGRVQPPRRRRLADQRGNVVDLGSHRGEQRRHGSVLGGRLGDHVQGPGVMEELRDALNRPYGIA